MDSNLEETGGRCIRGRHRKRVEMELMAIIRQFVHNMKVIDCGRCPCDASSKSVPVRGSDLSTEITGNKFN
jgi:hypothetical protein